jgi:hypothetical protein
MGSIATSNQLSCKILDALGIDPNFVTGVVIAMKAGEVAKIHVTRCITTEEAGKFSYIIKEEGYCLMQLKAEKSEEDEESKESKESEEGEVSEGED